MITHNNQRSLSAGIKAGGVSRVPKQHKIEEATWHNTHCFKCKYSFVLLSGYNLDNLISALFFGGGGESLTFSKLMS